MPVFDVNDPIISNYLTEIFEKEKKVKRKWAAEHAELLTQASTRTELKNHTLSSIVEKTMLAGLDSVTRDFISGARNRRTTTNRDPINTRKTIETSKEEPKQGDLSDKEFKLPSIMRPVDPEVTNILYEIGTQYGRLPYIKKRVKISPSNKYYNSPSINWDYGWAFEKKKHKQPEHGHVDALLRMQTESRVLGAIPDPPYYNPPDTGTYSKCDAGLY